MKFQVILLAFLAITAISAVDLELAIQQESTQAPASISARGPADLLLDHLDKIETQIRFEQADHQKLYDSQKSECDSEISIRTKAVVDGEDALRRAESHYIRCDSSLHEANADIAQIKAYQTEINGNVQGLTLQREREAQDYKRLVEEELNPAIDAVRGAYPILDEYAKDSSNFIQLTSYMTQSFKVLVQAGRGSMMAAPLTLLATLGGDFNPEDLQKVRRLFEELEADLVKAKDDAGIVENNRIEVFKATVAEYNAVLEQLGKTLDELTTYAGEMQACLVQEQAIIDSARAKITNNKAALSYALQMCGAFEEEFKNATAGRNSELELLAKLKSFIKEQAEIFGDYGTEESNVFDSYKSDYEKKIKDKVDSFIQLRQSKTQEHRNRMEKALEFKGKSTKKHPKKLLRSN